MADVIIGGDDQEGSSQGFFPGNHKKTSAAHLAFKAIAWTLYLLGGVLSFSIVALYSIISILAAIDFWIVKNLSGRILVGLRWWNKVTNDGESEWVFESIPDRKQISGVSSTFFWSLLIANVIFWIIMLIASIFSSWAYIPLCLICLVLGGSNFYGYARCKKGWQKQAAQYAMRTAQENPEVALSAMTAVAGMAAEGNGSSATNTAPSQQQQPQQDYPGSWMDEDINSDNRQNL